LQGKGVEIARKEIFKGPTIRIRVNLQGMDLSRKSTSGIRKEQYLQGKEFATLQGTELARKRRQYSACYTCESASRVIWMFLTFELAFLIVMEYTEIKSRGKLYICENQLLKYIIYKNCNHFI